MKNSNNILIGCDDNAILFNLLQSLKELNQYTVASASRMIDVINLTNVSKPCLVVLCFKNNQEAMNSLFNVLPKFDSPLFCLLKEQELKSFKWRQNRVVFTQTYSARSNNRFFLPQLRSILLLNSIGKSKKERSTRTGFASKYISDNKNLSRYVMELEQKKEILKKVRSQICMLFPDAKDELRQKLVSIANTIKSANNDQNHWDDFKLYFENVSPSFIARLSSKHPELTAKDIKYCCYLLMSMSNLDIGHLLGINLESVRTHKYRLKKKLHIDKNSSLDQYIKSL